MIWPRDGSSRAGLMIIVFVAAKEEIKGLADGRLVKRE
jgi:hypothetical protein